MTGPRQLMNGRVISASDFASATVRGGANGLLVRGVVVKTNEVRPTRPTTSLTCDVLVYGGPWRWRGGLLLDVLLSTDRDTVWRPKAATVDTAALERTNAVLDPTTLDGTHVLVGFMDDCIDLPVILRTIPRPGGPDIERAPTDDPSFPPIETSAPGHRRQQRELDPRVCYEKHAGAFQGIDETGSFVVDTTRSYIENGPGVAATGGGTTTSGYEAPSTAVGPTGDALAGNVNIRLPLNAKLLVEFAGGQRIELTSKDGKLVLSCMSIELGDVPAFSAVLFEPLKEYLENVLIVPTAFGPSGTPGAAGALVPDTVKSDNVKLKK